MRRSSLFFICFLTVAVVAGVYSCKRTSGIDNNNVITTPFTLYFSDTAGALSYTNDGRNYDGFVFPPDGRPCRALVTSVYNVLWAKTHLYYSANNGKNFNHTYDTLSTFPTRLCDGQVMDLNQSMLVNLPMWNNRVYTVSNSPNPNNWLGLIVSDLFGNAKSWGYDAAYDTDRTRALPVRMTSLTQLANGVLCGLAYSGPAQSDNYHVRNFLKAVKDATNDAKGRWREVSANPDGLLYIYTGNSSGAGLPPFGATYVDTSYFILGHMVNRLIAIDARCHYGAWYSDDTGNSWKAYSGLPLNTPLLCINAPFEEVCLVGTAGKGLYILNQVTNSWEPCNNGLGANLTVKNIAFKKNIYKNGTVRKFIYLATNRGIYESADGGRNWVLTIGGNFVAVY